MIASVSIIGSGNLAWHWCQICTQYNITVNEIASRNQSQAKELLDITGAVFKQDWNSFGLESDLVILAISDSAIEEIICLLNTNIKAIIHCSGSVPLSIFMMHTFKKIGVIYPLQTLSKHTAIDYKNTPFLIEANDTDFFKTLFNFASVFSSQVFEMSSEQRLKYHLAAVFVNNFSNHCFRIGFQFLDQNQLPEHLLIPLMQETVHKAIALKPKFAQTGPAKRKDFEIIEKHLQLLSGNTIWQQIYQNISKDIMNS